MRGRRLVAAGALFSACAAAACTNGTTPDCSDAQCGTVVSLSDGGDAARSSDAPPRSSPESSPDAGSDAAPDGAAGASLDGGVAGGG